MQFAECVVTESGGKTHNYGRSRTLRQSINNFFPFQALIFTASQE